MHARAASVRTALRMEAFRGLTMTDSAARCRPDPAGCPPPHWFRSSVAKLPGAQAVSPSRWLDVGSDTNRRAKVARSTGRTRRGMV
jgi:hypothetical protein